MPRNEGLQIEELARPLDPGVAGDVAAELADLPYVRLTQRVRPPPDRRELWWLLALVLLGHALLGWVAYRVLHPTLQRHAYPPIEVSVIEPATNLPPPPPLVAPPPLQASPAPPPRLHYVPPAKGAIQATLEGVKGPPLELYLSNGQIRLPANAPQQPAPTPAYRAPGIQGSRIYSGKSPVPYQPTRFNQDWAPANESLGAKTVGRAVDKAIEKTTVQKTMKLPGGMKVHCVLSPLALIAGCVPPPPQPPPENDNDVRLSMPPPETLTGKKVAVPKPASSAPPSASSSSH